MINKALPDLKKTLRRFVLPALLIAALFLVGGCGKEGAPKPRERNRSFDLRDVRGEAVGDCIAISGVVSANYQNLDRLRLELSPVRGPEDCPGCPFVAADSLYFSAAEAGLNPETGAFSINYCPAERGAVAPAYRWRLFALNIFENISHVSTPARLVAMPTSNSAKAGTPGGPAQDAAPAPAAPAQ